METVAISPGQNLALLCLKHWFKHIPRELYPPVKEVDELVRNISHMTDRLYYCDGEKPVITEEVLEDVISEACPWLCWERFGPIQWNAYTLFSRSLAVEALFMAKEGGCSAG